MAHRFSDTILRSKMDAQGKGRSRRNPALGQGCSHAAIKIGEFKSGHPNRTRPFQAGETFRAEQLNLHAQRFSKQLGDKDHIKVFANTTPTNNSSKRSS
jgi:hypothetical protein